MGVAICLLNGCVHSAPVVEHGAVRDRFRDRGRWCGCLHADSLVGIASNRSWCVEPSSTSCYRRWRYTYDLRGVLKARSNSRRGRQQQRLLWVCRHAHRAFARGGFAADAYRQGKVFQFTSVDATGRQHARSAFYFGRFHSVLCDFDAIVRLRVTIDFSGFGLAPRECGLSLEVIVQSLCAIYPESLSSHLYLFSPTPSSVPTI